MKTRIRNMRRRHRRCYHHPNIPTSQHRTSQIAIAIGDPIVFCMREAFWQNFC